MACALVTAGAPQSATAASWPQVSWGGNLAVTSDFIYRGLSQSSGSAALQADLLADTTGQWLIGHGVFATGGAGYYRSTGSGPRRFAATGYGYGNAGLALERRRWRLDFGYFLTQKQARELFSYPIADHHFAGTVSWHF